jgi:hypothetical protein
MDKAERDQILLVPSTNLAIVALKQEGAILGDSVRGFVDHCFRPGGNNYVGADLHSWYVAYCKAHNNTPQGYNKFVHHLQRVLSKQWRASTVVREGDKIKRIPAFWGGLQVLPCFIDSAANSEEDYHNNRPHVENWICLKTLCADGGLQELTGNLAITDITGTLPSVTLLLKNAETRMVTDVTGTLPSVTLLKNAETCMVTDVTALQGKSSQYEKTSSHEIADDLNSTAEGEPLTDVTRVTTIVTPTFEPSAKPCNNSKICKESHPSEPGTITGSEPEVEPTAQTASPIAPRVNWNSGDRVKVSASFADRTEGELELRRSSKSFGPVSRRSRLQRRASHRS